MAKFHGRIGYGKPTEIRPGVWDDVITDRIYSGDVLRNSRSLVVGGTLNDNINMSNEISIVADPFANENFQSIKYIEYMGTLWRVNNVDVQYPRLILRMGGVYNG
jgi:hypothetical protein